MNVLFRDIPLIFIPDPEIRGVGGGGGGVSVVSKKYF